MHLNELGFYTLAGAPRSPADLLDEVRSGEALRLGSTFVSERYNIKEAATLSGAVGAVSTRLGIATAATNHNTRHPLITASFATTMHRLTSGRFTLGLGRGIAPLFDASARDLRLKKTVGRLATYLQGYGDLLVSTNDWDPAVLRFRADDVVGTFRGAFDAKADTATLEHLAQLLPSEWLAPAATGSPKRCAERVLRQFDLGVDGVIMHGATPDELAPVVEAYCAIRPVGRFDALEANPGRAAPRP